VRALLLLPELARPVMVRLLLRHLLIPFLETGSLITLLLYDVYLFFLFLLGPCILAGHFVFAWDVQTLSIVYMTFVVYGQCLWFVFMAMCLDMCLWMCLDMYGCVSGYVYGFVWISGIDPPRGSVQQISRLTSPWGPFSSLLGLTP
jgi:hypothetical protein